MKFRGYRVLKKTFSIFLAIAFLAGLFPSTVLAETPVDLVSTITPSHIDAGYGPVAISVSVEESTFTPEATPCLLTKEHNDAGATITGSTVSSSKKLDFTLGSGLANGEYVIRIVDTNGTYNCGILNIGVQEVEECNICPLQIVIVESMALEEADRVAFVTTILEEIETSSDVDETMINNVNTYLPSMSDEDIEVALVSYSDISESRKGILNTAIRQGMDEIDGYESFQGITELINEKIVGDPGNINGLRFLVKLLKTVSLVAGPVATDMDPDNIDFRLDGNDTIKNVVSSLMDSLESLKAEISYIDEPTNFDKLLRYCEEHINSFTPEEIRMFKDFLEIEGIYEPDPDIGEPGEPGEPGGPRIEFYPDFIEEYYDDTVININGFNTSFSENTIVQVMEDYNGNYELDPEDVDTGKAGSVDFINESELAFTLQEGLLTGDYFLKTSTDGEIIWATIHINAHCGSMPLESFTAIFDPAEKANTYIEFETRGGDYSNANKIAFSIDGEYVNDDFPIMTDEFMGEEFNGCFNEGNLIITNETDSTRINLADSYDGVRSYIKSPGYDVVGFEIPIEPGQIEANKKYRITFGDDLHNSIFSSAINSIIPLEGLEEDNLYFRIMYDWNHLIEERVPCNKGQILQAKESLSDDFFGLLGTERVKYGHMHGKDIADVQEFGYYFFGNFSEFDGEVPTGDESGNVFIEGSETTSVTVDAVLSDSGNDMIYVGSELEIPMEVSVEDINTIEYKGEIGNYLNSLITYEFTNGDNIGNLKEDAKIFSVVKDSEGKIVEWKEITQINEMLVANPSIEINSPIAGPDDEGYIEGDVMPFVGYNHDWEDQPKIIIYGTADEHSDQIIVDGETSYVVDGETVTIPFALRMNKHWGNGEESFRDAFEVNSYFVNYRETNRYNPSASEMTEWENGIPVHPLYENTITITYEYLDIDKQDQVEAGSFTWERGVLTPDEVWCWANSADDKWGFGIDSAVDIKIVGLEGNPDYLSGVVKYYQYSGTNVKVNTLIELNGVEEVTDEYSMDENFEDRAQVFRFYYTTGTNFFNTYTGDLEDLNGIEARVFLKYNDPAVGKEPYEVRCMSVDTMPPNVNDWDGVKYNGVNEDEESYFYGKEEVIVRFNDPINFEDVELNKDDYFTMLDRNGNVAEAAPIDVVGYRDEWEPDNPWDPYRSIKLYFNDVKPGYKLSIIGVSDEAGNKITTKITKNIKMERKVNITLQYEDGQQVANGSVEMVEINSILESEFGPGKKPNVDFRRIEINQWCCDQWLDIGTYQAFRSEDRSYNEWENPASENRNGTYSIDQEINIPFSLDTETPLDIVITIPDNNVKGKVNLDPEYVEDGMEVIVINTDYLEGEWAGILEDDEQIIYEAFGKIMKVSAIEEEGQPITEGEFEGYLQPGEYKVIGKRSGFSIIEPENSPYIFTVPESEEIYNIHGDNGNIVFPKMNVIGRLATSNGNLFHDTTVVITGETSEGVKKEASAITNWDGLFATSLPEGSYTLNFVQANNHPETCNSGIFHMDVSFDIAVDVDNIDGDDDLEELIPVNVSGKDVIVGEDEITTLKDIVVPDANVSFIVSNGETYENGDPIPVWGAQLELIQGDEEGGPFLWSDSGKFDFYLNPGDYNIAKAGSREIFIDDLNYMFNVANDGTIIDKEENILQSPINIDLTVNSNLSIKLFKTVYNEDTEQNDEEPVTYAGIQIEGKNNGIWSIRTTNNNGLAYFNLEPGRYRIASYYNPEAGWQQCDYDFVIVEDEKTELVIEIKAPNVTGIAYTDEEDEEGNSIPLINGWVDIEKVPGENEFFSKYYGTRTAGEDEYAEEGQEPDPPGYFALTLEEGEYVVRSIGNWQNWYEINLKFFVDENGQLLDKNGESIDSLEVKKPAPNIKGYVYKNELKELYVGNQNQSNNNTWDTVEGEEPIEGEELIEEATEPEPPEWIDVWLILRQTNVDDETYHIAPWIYEKWIEVEYDGSFKIAVDEVNRYKPIAVTNAGRWIELDETSIKIEDPEGVFRLASEDEGEIEEGSMVPNVNTTFAIIPPIPNFSGVMKDFDGNVIGPGWLNIERIDENGCFTDWRGMEVDSNGEFGMKLKEGETYIIRDAWIRDETLPDPWMNQKRYSFNRKVTIGEDSSEITLKPNTKIKLDLGGELEFEVDYDWYTISTNIRKILDESDEEYDNYMMNPWMYETWGDLEYNEEDEVYELYTYLDIGKYEVMGISYPNGWKEVKEQFDVTDPDMNDIPTINAIPNVVGTVIDDEGNPISNAWIDFERVTETYNYNDPCCWDNRWVGTNSNSSGNFSLKLKDNEEGEYYRINGYHTPGTWDSGCWIPGNRVEVKYSFKVIEGQMTDMEGNVIYSIDLATNVTGMFKRIYKLGRDNPNNFIDPVNGEESQVREAWFTIKPYKRLGDVEYIDYANWEDTIWASTNGTGEFKMMLSDGKYRLIDVGTMNNWYNLEITFEVKDGQLVEGSKYVVDGLLVAKPPIQNFSGIVYRDAQRTEVVNWGSFSVKPKSAAEHDWSGMKWFNTKGDGSFEGSLGEGEWKVVEISGPGYWEKVNIPLTVDENLNISSSWDENVSEEDTAKRIVVPDDAYEFGKVTLSKKEPNVKGIVMDSNGQRLYQHAWVTIKPANASSNDWSDAVGCEYNWYDGEFMFRTNLSPGDYKVVDVGSWNFWYETDIRFTVNENGMVSDEDGDGNLDNGFEMLSVYDSEFPVLVIEPPTPNVEGTVYSGETTDTNPLMWGWISLARFDESGTQLTMDGSAITPLNGGWKSPHDDIYWMHTRWTGTDENGQLKLSLKDGYYKIISANGMDVWYQPETEFMIEDGQLNNISGEAIGEITVTKPGPNIEITIKHSGSTDSTAWLDIKDMDNRMIFTIMSTSKDADGNFIFREKLKEGTHKIVGFFSRGQWKEIETDVFEVPVDGEIIYDFNGDVKEIVSGKLYTDENDTVGVGKGYKVLIQEFEEGTGLVGDTKQVKTSDDGTFEFKLRPDEVWAVVSVTSKDGAYKYSEPESGNTYTVIDTEENEQEGWDIVISDIS